MARDALSAAKRLAVSPPAGKTARRCSPAPRCSPQLLSGTTPGHAGGARPSTDRPVRGGRWHPAALSRAGPWPARGPAARQRRERRGLRPQRRARPAAQRGIASSPSIAPASATAIGHRAYYGRRQSRLICSAMPSPGLALSAPWSSAIPGARWWPWRWRSTIRMRSAASSCCPGYYKPTARLDVLLGSATGHTGARRRAALHASRRCWGARCCRSTSRPCSRHGPCPNGSATASPTAFPSDRGRSAPKRRTPRPWSRPWRRCALATRAAAPGDDHGRHRGQGRRLRRQAVWFHEAIPGSELHLVPDTGHMFHYAVPGQVAEAITATVQKRQMTTAGSEPASTPSVVGLGHRPAA